MGAGGLRTTTCGKRQRGCHLMNYTIHKRENKKMTKYITQCTSTLEYMTIYNLIKMAIQYVTNHYQP